MNISLKQLEIFVTIVECGNFTEAGRRMYLAQSTVSSHISALEHSAIIQTEAAEAYIDIGSHSSVFSS